MASSFLFSDQPCRKEVGEEGDQENNDEDEKNPYFLKAIPKQLASSFISISSNILPSFKWGRSFYQKISRVKRNYSHSVGAGETIMILH